MTDASLTLDTRPLAVGLKKAAKSVRRFTLTVRQAEAEHFIREYLETRGYSPSVADVAAWLGVSRTTAHRHLTALKRKSRIVADRFVARSIRRA